MTPRSATPAGAERAWRDAKARVKVNAVVNFMVMDGGLQCLGLKREMNDLVKSRIVSDGVLLDERRVSHGDEAMFIPFGFLL